MLKKLFLTITIALITPFFTLADGGIFPPPDYVMYETDQKAVIFYENGLETLILSASFRGDAKDFGWVIPTPSRPEVSKSSDELFTALDELTRVEEDYLRPLSFDEAYQVGLKSANVYIVETKKIEYYDITVLTADNPDALADWLDENNYQFPTGASYILDSYVDNGWYFTAIKIDTEAISSGVSQQLRQGHMIPLQLKFSTDKIVYPLKISSLMQDKRYSTAEHSVDYDEDEGIYRPEPILPDYPQKYYYYPQKVGILIYVFTSENKQTIPGFTTQYAGWVKKETIEELAFDDDGDSWIKLGQDKYFLTKLTRWMSYAEMTHDLYLRNAPDNNLVNVSPLEESSKIWFWVIISISAVMIFGISGIFIYLSRE